MLNLSAAFDTIDYDVLCDVLECHLGICGTSLDLLRFFKAALNKLLLMEYNLS